VLQDTDLLVRHFRQMGLQPLNTVLDNPGACPQPVLAMQRAVFQATEAALCGGRSHGAATSCCAVGIEVWRRRGPTGWKAVALLKSA